MSGGWNLCLPLVAFAAVMAIVAVGMYRPADRTVYLAMVGKRLPQFVTPPLLAGKAGVFAAGLGNGKPKLLNILISWCMPCIAEARQLMALKAAGVTIEGTPESLLMGGDGTILIQLVGDIRADEVPGIVAHLKAAR